MNISITLPDPIAAQISNQWADLPRRTLEALVADACREKVISNPQAQQILGLESRLELDAFLKKSGVYLEYSDEDLNQDIQTLDQLLGP